MVLSANAARTLEQVKSGLSILYGADYFTEEEWIKLDGLIHKGNYVFTRGPQANILDEELMSFDDFDDITSPSGTTNQSPPSTNQNLPSANHDLASAVEQKLAIVTEQQIPSPISSSEKSELNSPKSLKNEPSADEAQTSVSPAVAEQTPAPRPANGGLAFYTQAQLDEVRAFNTNLTKAGQKGKPGRGGQRSRPDYPSSVEHTFDAAEDVLQTWGEQTDKQTWGNIPTTGGQAWGDQQNNEVLDGEQNDSPTSAEQASRIETWADDVEGLPVPAFTPVSGPSNSKHSSSVVTSARVTPIPTNIAQVVEKFVQVHGKPPRNSNDVYQPNNPAFKGPRRPDSRASVRSSMTTAKGPRKLYATGGTMFLAHGNFEKKSHITMEVKAGDSIKYLKHVSGIMHTGLNLRTKQQGQFPESVLEPTQPQAALIQKQRSAMQFAYGRERGMSIASASHGLDRVEAMNAAEWDRESISSRPTTATTGPMAPVPVRSGALAGSRFAALVEMDSQDGQSERGRGQTQAAMIRQIIREELGSSAQNGNSIQRSQTTAPDLENALTNIVPKVTTCWWWKTKNDCRFTAEECIHLHADLPDGGEPSNLRLRKPTWGALADVLPPSPATTTATEPIFKRSSADAPTSAEPRHPSIEFKHFSKSKTCYYWATDGKCNNSAVDCKYLHEYTAAGVAHQPGGYALRKKDFNWSRIGRNNSATEDQPTPEATPTSPNAGLRTNEYGWGSPDGKAPIVTIPAVINDTWGDLTADENAAIMSNPNAAIWGAVEGSSAWDMGGDVYKPPHVKVLEERERIASVGW